MEFDDQNSLQCFYIDSEDEKIVIGNDADIDDTLIYKDQKGFKE